MNYYQIQDFRKYLKHPEKYKGTGPATMRSGWEIKFSTYLDQNPSVLHWASEEIVLNYDFMDPIKKTIKKHRYFTDFWMQVLDSKGKIKEYIIEIKPYKETIPPEKPKRVTKAYQKRVFTYLKNQAKWSAAREFCAQQKLLGKEISFMILTENELPL